MTRAEDQTLVDALAEEARRVAEADSAGQPAPGAWHRLDARRQATARGGARRWTIAVALWMLAIAGVGWRLWRAGAPAALTYAVAGATVAEAGYVRSGSAGSARLEFSDGTRVSLGRSAKLSVASTGANGARLRLQDGGAHFEVVHRPHAAWTVEAGPYTIEVTGTVFDVRWSGAEEIAEVHLRAGSVRVTGPLLTERATLRAGQNLIARLAAHEVRIEDNEARRAAEDDAAPSDAPPAGAAQAATPAGSPDPEVSGGQAPADVDLGRHPADEPTAAARRAPAPPAAKKRVTRRLASATPPPPATRPAWSPEGWTARVAAGDTKAILTEAEAHGLDSVLEQADAPALIALADAARYEGRPDLAGRVLAVQRRRFPGTPAAANAAFFLGRLADDAGKPSEALDWYRRYLAEQPRGPYASEALGRAMLGVARVSGHGAAREMAEEYLARFPNGTYLLHARQILATP